MTCSFPTCTSEATHGEHCFLHNAKYGVKQPKKAAQPIAKMSAKKKKEAPGYRKFVAEYLSRPENKVCNIQIEGICTFQSETINHLKRRSKETIMNEEFIEPSCYACNVEIENRDGWARENGHLLSKFN